MTDILNELLADIISLGEADEKNTNPSVKPKTAADVKPSNAKFSAGGKWYSDAKHTDYVGRIESGKWIPATAAEKQAERQKKGQAQKTEPVATPGSQPSTQPTTQSTQAQVDKQKVIDDIGNKIKSIKDEVKRDALTKLQNALMAGDAEALKKLIDEMGLEIGKSRALKARKLSGKKQDITSGDKELTRQIYDLAKASGVEIPGSSEEEAKGSSEEFKPQSIFKAEQLAQLDVKEVDGGIEIEGQRFEEITDETKIKEIENSLLERARQKLSSQGRELDPAYEDRIRKYVRSRIEASNHNIRYVREQTRGGKPLPAYEFRGQEGSKLISERLSVVLDTHVVDEKQRTEAQTALTDMASARNPKEFNAAYERFSKAVQGTPVHKNIKYIAETITALRVTAFGGTALIPRSESFPLADVISVKKNPITGEVDIDQILVDVDEEQEISVAGSVKAGKGAGSGNTPKIQNSRFNTSNVDGVDCSTVVDDMMRMAAIERRNSIFQPTEDGDVTPEEKQRIFGELEKYGPIIKAYYGITDDMTTEQLYEFLSYGKQMVCLDGKPSPTPDGVNGEPFTQAKKRNGRQWRAWSVVGLMTEAIHNRTVEMQYYHTLRYNGVIKSADGIRRFSKMQFQPFKKEAGKEGNTRPDQAQNAFTIPASPEETRNGNPCAE